MNRTSLIRKILQLYRAGEPLNISAVQRNHPQLLEAAFSLRPFLGWKQAIDLAGLRYQDLKTDLAPEIPCLICGTHRKSLSRHLPNVHSIDGDEYRQLYPDAELIAEESRARNYPPPPNPELPHWEPLWTIPYVLDRTWQWYLKYGQCNAIFIAFKDLSLLTITHNRGIPWDDVIRRLGLDPTDERKAIVPHPILSRDQVLQAIRHRHSTGLPLDRNSINRDHPSLAVSIGAHFLSGTRAIRLATGTGRAPSSLRIYPDKKSIFDALRQRRDSGQTMEFSILSTEDPLLRDSIAHYFDTYLECLEKARIRIPAAPTSIQAHLRTTATLTSEEALTMLKERHREGHPLIRSKTPSFLLTALSKKYQTWSDALAAAGLSETARKDRKLATRKSHYSTPGSVIDTLRTIAASGTPLHPSEIRQSHPRLRHAVYHHFNSWPEAFKSASLHEQYLNDVPRANSTPYPDPASIIRALQQIHREGRPLTGSEIKKEALLRSALYQHFPSIRLAAEAAGLLPAYISASRLSERLYPDPPSVIQALNELHGSGHPLKAAALESSHPTLYTALLNHFGNFGPAMKAAGLEEHLAKSRRRPKRTYPPKEETLAALRKRRENGLPISGQAISKSGPELYHQVTHHFKKISTAIEAAGLTCSSLETGHRHQSDDSILQQLKDWITSRQTHSDRIRFSDLNAHDNRLHHAVTTRFGTVYDALKAIGLDHLHPRHHLDLYPDPASVIAALRSLRDQNMPTQKVALEQNNIPLLRAITRHFRSFRSALSAAGVEHHRPPSDPDLPTPASVLEKLRSLHGKGNRLTALAIIKEDSRLWRGIIRHFGTLGKARKAARIRPPSHLPKPAPVYSKPETVIEAIRNHLSPHEASAPTPSIWKNDPKLYRAATRHFGSWEKAKHAALGESVEHPGATGQARD